MHEQTIFCTSTECNFLFVIRLIGTDIYRISSTIKQAPFSLFIAAFSYTLAMKNNIDIDPSDNKESAYVYAHIARRLKQKKKEEKKISQESNPQEFFTASEVSSK